ncbi:MAG: SGNH/GDSL hydrolase family protein [Pseudomonadota bacterium]
MSTILCFGDSNTHGTIPLRTLGEFRRYPRGTRWPDVMAADLGPEVEVIAEGLPGRTTVHDDPIDGGVRSGLAVLPALLLSHAPIDLVIVMLGTNDLKPRFSVTAFEIAASVGRLIKVIQAEGVARDILIVAPVPVTETGVLAPVFEGAEDRQIGLSQNLHRVADALGAGFVEAGLHIATSSQDGVHWDAEAHATFGKIMADVVRHRLGGATP